RLDAIRKEEGAENKPFEVHVISLDAYSADGCKRLEDRGVTDVIVGFRIPYIKGPDTEPLAKKIEHLERFAEGVVSKVSA
ncbi:MAG: rutA 3, partial [Aeromicrobium sp.]|nr:rutA 3 [Aeromicrobium sp.]